MVARPRTTKVTPESDLIPDIDLQIAATDVTLDLMLLTRNHRHITRAPLSI